MKLYLLSQKDDNGYDTYDSVVVAAESCFEAVRITPCGQLTWDDEKEIFRYPWDKEAEGVATGWARHVDNINCIEIGYAHDSVKKGVVLSSFNAG